MPKRLEKLRIVGVAIMGYDCTIHSLLEPNRHHDVIRMMVNAGESIPINGEQGFLLSDGRFARRVVAKQYAKDSGQILEGRGKHKDLYSEDLW